MDFVKSMKCIGYNLVSNFYIILNMMFPFYSTDIINLQYKTIEYLNESEFFDNNNRKRKRFCMFTENLVKKNNDIIEKIRQKEEEDNNIENYEKVIYENQDKDDDFSVEENSDTESQDLSQTASENDEEKSDDSDASDDSNHSNESEKTGDTETIYEESLEKKEN
jgi:hypothetical protein